MTLFDDTPEPETPKAEDPVVLTTREISRFVSFYSKNVRLHSVQETKGVFTAIKRLLAGNAKKGQRPLLPQEIADALKNYSNDPFTQRLDQRQRKHMRSFFTYETVTVWLKPIVRRPAVQREEALDRLEQLGRRRAAPIAPPPTIEPETEETSSGF